MVKHIALVTTSYVLNSSEGEAAAGTFVADFARELSHHVKVTVVAPALTDSKVIEGDLEVIYFKVPRLPLSLLSPMNPLHWFSIFLTLYRGRSAVINLCQNKKIDHILAFWALPSGYWAQTAARRYKLQYSTWSLGSDVWSLGKIPVVRTKLINVLSGAQQCYSNSHFLAKKLVKLLDREYKILLSTRRLPGIKKRHFTSNPPYRFAFLGRWHHNKGIDLFLQALLELDNSHWNCIEIIKIYGGGPLKSQVEVAAKNLSDAGREVRVGGYLDTVEACQLLEWADYLVIPSRIESMPVVSSDALQAGCVLICTPVGDLPELINNYNVGFCAQDISVNALVKVVEEALSIPPVSFAHSIDKAKKLVSVESSVKQLLNDLKA